MLRILWNEEETSILVSCFMKFKDGLLTRKEAVKMASTDLRKRAIRIGLEIDDTFRNENGISMQMSKIEDLFYQRKNRLSKAPKLFEDILNLYCQNSTEFNRILMEANGMFQQEIVTDNLENYETVLSQYFPKGFRLSSNLDAKKFIHFLNELNHTELNENDENIRFDVRRNLTKIGIQHEDYIFSVSSLLDEEVREQLFTYIKNSFSEGKKVLFYQAIFNDFNEKFLGQRIYDTDILKSYLMHELPDYYYEKNYISSEQNSTIDLTAEIRSYLVEQAVPVKTSEIYQALSHFPPEKIDSILHANQEFICNTWGEYFHVSVIDFSKEEIQNISNLIQQRIEESHFVSGHELILAVNQKYPELSERLAHFSEIGLRNTIAYYLKNQFAFHGNIISSLDTQFSMEEVFANFASTHDSFTLAELNVLKNELGTPIYFQPVYENSLRVSQEKFVSKKEACFQITETDTAVSRFCADSYISLQEVSNFSAFPDAGFPWNVYLLEHYIAMYSQQYQLFHIGFNAEKCVGAIVKRNSGIKDFNDLIINLLAKSKIVLNKENALQYLKEKGYIARKKYSGIENILIHARAKRG